MLAGACRLQSALGRALAAFLGVLDGMTLADLLDPAARSGAAARRVPTRGARRPSNGRCRLRRRPITSP